MIGIERRQLEKEKELLIEFVKLEGRLGEKVLEALLGWAGEIKSTAAKLMYRQRGRFSQSFINMSMGVMAFGAIALSSEIESLMISGDERRDYSDGVVMEAETVAAETVESNSNKGDISEYIVRDGDTISSIAQKFGVSIDTIVWENELKSVDAIKPHQKLKILPITGIRHKVKRGETVYSIAKRYSVDAQNIIDYPFNSFANDETFALSAGQELVIPEGIKPKETVIDTNRYLARTVAPVPGVVGEGNFMWPTSGHISQKFYWYHQAVDIANRSNPEIVAAQGGTVVTAGWSGGGYGNYVVIDHGNGYKTLYAHMLNNSVVVKPGQVVGRGTKLGIMGSTGRSTGTHLHFEVISPKGHLDPLSVLK
jgi:LysM repeat protein